MRGRLLFDKVVEMCGISGVLGPGLVRRALSDRGVDPGRGRAEDYEEALPRLRERLATYVPPEEADDRIRRIARMLADVKAELARGDDAEWSTFGRVFDELRADEPDEDARAAARHQLMQTGERVKEGVEILPIRRDKASNDE